MIPDMRRWLGVFVAVILVQGCGGKMGARGSSSGPSTGSVGGAVGSSGSVVSQATTHASGGNSATTANTSVTSAAVNTTHAVDGQTAGSGGSGGDTNSGATGALDAGSGGSAGDVSGQPADGFVCASFGSCLEGMACVNCDFLGGAVTPLCAPHPDLDPEAFEAATSHCPAVNLWFECDGAEDCPVAEYCTWDPDDSSRSFSYGECHPTPVACDGQSGCTFCNDDADCPEGWACHPTEYQGLLSGRSGCVDEKP